MDALTLIRATVEPVKRNYMPGAARALSDLVEFRPRSPQIHGMHNAEAYLGRLKSHPLVKVNIMRAPGVLEPEPTDIYVTVRLEKDGLERYWDYCGSVSEATRELKAFIADLLELLESNRGTGYADFRRAFREFGRAHKTADSLTGKSLWDAYCRAR